MGFEILRLYRGDGHDERLVLQATSDDNIGKFIAMDSTYDAKTDTLTNIFRHTYWFPHQDVKKGEKVILYTKKHKTGKTYSYEPPANGNVGKHIFYWGSNSNVWNDDADSVTLLEVSDVEIKKFKDIQSK